VAAKDILGFAWAHTVCLFLGFLPLRPRPSFLFCYEDGGALRKDLYSPFPESKAVTIVSALPALVLFDSTSRPARLCGPASSELFFFIFYPVDAEGTCALSQNRGFLVAAKPLAFTPPVPLPTEKAIWPSP